MVKVSQQPTSALQREVKNEHALMAIFVALAAFFFAYNGAVQGERTLASVTDQVVVVAH